MSNVPNGNTGNRAKNWYTRDVGNLGERDWQMAITVKEMANAVGVGECVIRAWVRRGKLTPSVRLGRAIGFLPADVDDAIAVRDSIRESGASFLPATEADGHLISLEQAAEILGLTSRQVRRLMVPQVPDTVPVLQGYRPLESTPHGRPAAVRVEERQVREYARRRTTQNAA